MINPPASKRGPRFSLLNLLFLLTSAAAVLGLIRANERNDELMVENARVVAKAETVEAENAALRAELGVITVADPTKFHAMQLESENDLEWKWRVYMPEDSGYRLLVKRRSVRKQGGSSSGAGSYGQIEPGQQTITYRIFKDEAKGYWRSELKTKSSTSGGSVEPVGEWPGRSTRLGTLFSSGRVKAVELGEPIKLFELLLEGHQVEPDAEPWPQKPSVSTEVMLVPRDWEPPADE